MRTFAILVVAVTLFSPTVAQAQTTPTVRLTRRAVIMDQPRVDGFVIATLDPGETLEVVTLAGNWYQIATPSRISVRRAWIQASAVEWVTARPPVPGARPPGKRLIRGFVQAGGTVFNAKDSFETILGSATGAQYGLGGQVVLPSGTFVQASVEQFKKTGSRVLVSGSQAFSLPIPDVVTMMPVQVTVGYRDPSYGRAVPYVGFGLGWHTLREESPALTETAPVKRGHVGVHLLGGAELPIASWLAIAGEAQWTSTPKLLGTTGVSAVVHEDDLGGGTFRFKLIVGR